MVGNSEQHDIDRTYTTAVESLTHSLAERIRALEVVRTGTTFAEGRRYRNAFSDAVRQAEASYVKAVTTRAKQYDSQNLPYTHPSDTLLACALRAVDLAHKNDGKTNGHIPHAKIFK